MAKGERVKGYESAVVLTRKKETEKRVGLRDRRAKRALDGGTAREMVVW